MTSLLRGKFSKADGAEGHDGPQVLLVDDDAKFAGLMATYLTQNGLACETCNSGAECLQKLELASYDVIVCDIMMSDNSGLDLARQITEKAPNSALILLTGHPSLDTAIGAANLRVFRYLLKPVELPDLLKEIRHACQHSTILDVVRQAHSRLGQWLQDVSAVQNAMTQPRNGPEISVDTFINLSFANIMSSLSDLSHFIDGMSHDGQPRHVCSLLDCPKLRDMQAVVRYTISVLDRTKRSFKSKEIGELRRYLERYLAGEVPAPQAEGQHRDAGGAAPLTAVLDEEE